MPPCAQRSRAGRSHPPGGCLARPPDLESTFPPGETDLPDACPLGPAGDAPQADLIAWRDRITAGTNEYFGAKGPEAAAEAVERAATDDERLAARTDLAYAWLRLGETTACVDELTGALAEAGDVEPWRPLRAREIRALCLMRRGEVTNCREHGGAAACIVPFDPSAEHADPADMGAAIADWLVVLEATPDDLRARWLLNVAHMAIGTWPEGVPPTQRLPPSVLRSEDVVGRFTNIARQLGLHELALAGGVVADDLSGDGRIDLLLTSSDPSSGTRLLVQQPGGRFCDRSVESGLVHQTGGFDVTHADYDNDGDQDLYLTRGAFMPGDDGVVRGSLLRNDGAGGFEDVTVAAGLADNPGPNQVSAWADFDNDGDLDLFSGQESWHDDPAIRHAQLFRNEGDGTFVDVAPALGVDAVGQIKGAAWADYDDDDDQDLYVVRFYGPNSLLRNDGDRFVDVAAELGVEAPLAGFTTWWMDYDQDGRLDLWVSAFPEGGGPVPSDQEFGAAVSTWVADRLGLPHEGETSKLYRNLGGRFEDVTAKVGLDDFEVVMGGATGDLDNDGWPDLYLATGFPSFDALVPKVAYRNQGGQHFADVTASMGTGSLQKGHGTAFADVDGDGDQDLFTDLGGLHLGDSFMPALYENPGNYNHFVHLRLRGTTSARDAIGARVRIESATRTFHHVVGPGSSFGASTFEVQAGLGEVDRIDRVVVRWPHGESSVYTGVEVDAVWELTEGETLPVLLSRVAVDVSGEHEEGGHAASAWP